MSIITIFTDAYSNGRELAKTVARKMDYPCVGQEIVASAAKTYDVPEEKIVRFLKSMPSFLSRVSGKKHHFAAYLEAAVATNMLNQDLVYHGFIGLPWFQNVSHIMKVRVIANLEDRISVAIQKEKLQGKVEAQDRIFKQDEEVKQWAKAVYNIDIADSALYDLVINMGHMGADDAEDAIETIISTANHKKFQPMTYSLNCMKNIEMSCRVRAAFVDIDPKMEVKSDRGTVYIYTKALRRKKQEAMLDFKREVMNLDGVGHVEVYVKKDIFDDKARGQ